MYPPNHAFHLLKFWRNSAKNFVLAIFRTPLRKWVNWNGCCTDWGTFDFDLWSWIFKVKLYLGNGRPNCHGTKGTGVDSMPWCKMQQLCDLEADWDWLKMSAFPSTHLVHKNASKSIIWEIMAILSRGRWDNGFTDPCYNTLSTFHRYYSSVGFCNSNGDPAPTTLFLLIQVSKIAKTALTHWGRDEMNNISQTTFSNVFSSMKMFEFRLKFHWSLFPRVQLTIFQHWFR